MKIKRLHTQHAVIDLDYKISFRKEDHKIEFLPELGMFQIDSVLIPVSNVREVLVEPEESLFQEEIVEAPSKILNDKIPNNRKKNKQ